MLLCTCSAETRYSRRCIRSTKYLHDVNHCSHNHIEVFSRQIVQLDFSANKLGPKFLPLFELHTVLLTLIKKVFSSHHDLYDAYCTLIQSLLSLCRTPWTCRKPMWGLPSGSESEANISARLFRKKPGPIFLLQENFYMVGLTMNKKLFILCKPTEPILKYSVWALLADGRAVEVFTEHLCIRSQATVSFFHLEVF